MDYLPFSFSLTFSALCLFVFLPMSGVSFITTSSKIPPVRSGPAQMLFSHVACQLAYKGSSDWFVRFGNNFQSLSKGLMCSICKYSICSIALGLCLKCKEVPFKKDLEKTYLPYLWKENNKKLSADPKCKNQWVRQIRHRHKWQEQVRL